MALAKREVNKMENNQPGQTALKISAEQLQGELDKIESKWLRIPKGEAIVARFRMENGKPVIYKRSQVFKDKATGKDLPATDMIDFEMEDVMKEPNKDGEIEHKVLSRNMKNSDVQKILDFLKQGKSELMLSADNNGKVSVASVKR